MSQCLTYSYHIYATRTIYYRLHTFNLQHGLAGRRHMHFYIPTILSLETSQLLGNRFQTKTKEDARPCSHVQYSPQLATEKQRSPLDQQEMCELLMMRMSAEEADGMKDARAQCHDSKSRKMESRSASFEASQEEEWLRPGCLQWSFVAPYTQKCWISFVFI